MFYNFISFSLKNYLRGNIEIKGVLFESILTHVEEEIAEGKNMGSRYPPQHH